MWHYGLAKSRRPFPRTFLISVNSPAPMSFINDLKPNKNFHSAKKLMFYWYRKIIQKFIKICSCLYTLKVDQIMMKDRSGRSIGGDQKEFSLNVVL
jgi:hypothetical protein